MRIAISLNKHDKTSSINNAYVEYISMAGYTPIMFSQSSINASKEAASICEGLLLKGGNDIEPLYYGDDNTASFKPDPELDSFERDLIAKFLFAKKPIFGICRGFQLLFLELRERKMPMAHLDFKQHIKGHNQNELEIARNIPSHFVFVNPSVYGEKPDHTLGKRIGVNSLHHQGVAVVGKVKFSTVVDANPNMQILAMASGIVEAFSVPLLKIMAVQWHPEEMRDTRLLNAFFGQYSAEPLGMKAKF